MTASKGWKIGIAAALAMAGAWALVRAQLPQRTSQPYQNPSLGVYTPAHPSLMAAAEDFINRRPTHPTQPIAFPHKVHLAKGLQCDSCHAGTDTGPDAVIPNVKFCMSCHQVIATDRPEIKKIAAFQARGEDIAWARVYNYSQSAHVKFNHAPHIAANVACSSCHGDMSKQTTAERVVNANMGFCLTCHEQRKAPVDCQTCHY